jgi:hypothetical protein
VAGGAYILIAVTFAIATGVIGRSKGSSFLLWFVIGGVVPLLGLIAVILFRREADEPVRRCPSCDKELKLYVQVCSRCGADLYLPERTEAAEVGPTATRP